MPTPIRPAGEVRPRRTKQTPSIPQTDPTLERTFQGHSGDITSLSWSSRDEQLASGSVDNSVIVWNFKPRLRAFRYQGHKAPVLDVKFSPDGSILASASKDRTVRLWKPTVRGESFSMKGHAGAVRSVDFSWDGAHLLTCSDDKTIKMWNVSSHRFECTFHGHSNWVRSACFSADGVRVVSGGDDKHVKLWDVTSHVCLHTFYDHEDNVNTVGFHPDGTCLAAGSDDASIKLWDARAGTRQLLQHYSAHSGPVNRIKWHPSGNYILSAGLDSCIRIWDLRAGHLLYTLHGHKGAALGIDWDQSGSWFSSGGADQTVLIWKANFDTIIDNKSAIMNQVPQGSSKETITAHEDTAPKPAKSLQVPHTITDTNVNSSSMKFQPLLHHAIDSSIQTQSLPHRSNDTSRHPQHKTFETQLSAQNIDTTADFSTVNPESTVQTSQHTEYQLRPSPAPLSEMNSNDSMLKATLQHIVGQLDTLTHAVSMLDRRLTATEQRVGVNQFGVHQSSSAASSTMDAQD